MSEAPQLSANWRQRHCCRRRAGSVHPQPALSPNDPSAGGAAHSRCAPPPAAAAGCARGSSRCPPAAAPRRGATPSAAPSSPPGAQRQSGGCKRVGCLRLQRPGLAGGARRRASRGGGRSTATAARAAKYRNAHVFLRRAQQQEVVADDLGQQRRGVAVAQQGGAHQRLVACGGAGWGGKNTAETGNERADEGGRAAPGRRWAPSAVHAAVAGAPHRRAPAPGRPSWRGCTWFLGQKHALGFSADSAVASLPWADHCCRLCGLLPGAATVSPASGLQAHLGPAAARPPSRCRAPRAAQGVWRGQRRTACRRSVVAGGRGAVPRWQL